MSTEIVEYEETGTDLIHAPTDALVHPAPLSEVKEVMTAYQNLCRELLDKNDLQKVGNKEFKKKSAWRKLAVAFRVTFELRERNIERKEDGSVIYAEFVYRALAPNGRFADGWGACSARERGFNKPDHDIPATAETRAKNRAAADLFGMGEVSAEEVQAGTTTATPQATPATAAERKKLTKVLADLAKVDDKTQWETIAGKWTEREFGCTVDAATSSQIKQAVEKFTDHLAKLKAAANGDEPEAEPAPEPNPESQFKIPEGAKA